MITIDSLIGQMKSLFAIKTPVRFDTPEYIQFYNDLIQYIYENHFEESDEWKIISRNLVYTSTQRMATGEGNTILIQLDALKRRELELRFAIDWKLVHPDIIRVARSLYQDGHYFESARSAFIEINARVKKLFPELRGKDGKQLDGYPLMQTVFSAKTPKLVIADTSTDTGENVQRGFMDMFAGAAAALRNPKAHENDFITAENAARQLMFASIVLTTAEDIVAVVDAVIAKGSEAAKDFIAEFTGIATDDQVLKALQMACELQLIVFDSSRGCYGSPSFLARKLVSASSDEQKAVFMRLILEQYAPYNTFKTRYGFTKSIELACRQTKTLHMMTSNERDVKNTLISIATYAKALKSEGANLYSFVEDVDAVGIIEAALRSANITENSLRTYWGENLYTFVNTSNVFAPLIEALQKTHSGTMDVRSIVVCAANAFESFLADFAVRKGVSLSGRNGILQKRDALSAHISKKHRGMIEFVGQVRNAADHGADPDENNQVWTISNETARIYPCIIAALIKAIFSRDATGSIEV